MSRFFLIIRFARDIAVIALGVLAVAILLTRGHLVHAETFENKDTAKNRHDESFGTPATDTDIRITHDGERESMTVTPPAPKPERDYYDNMVITVNPNWPTNQTSTTSTSTTTGVGSTNSTSTTTTTTP